MNEPTPEQMDLEVRRITVAFALAVFVMLVAVVKGCWPS